MQRILKIFTALLVLSMVGLIAVALMLSADYRELIYPGVTIGGYDIGGRTPDQAAARLASKLPSLGDQALVVKIPDEAPRHLTWSEVGRSYDIPAAVDTAYDVGRERAWWLNVVSVLQPIEVAVEVPVTPTDPALVRAHVEQLAENVAMAPVDATLALGDGQVVTTPAQEGRRLDVDAATEQILTALEDGADVVRLTPESVPPQIPTAEPALSRAQALLGAHFVVVVDDPLTGDLENGGYHAEFAASPEDIASWLDVRATDRDFMLELRPDQVRAWLEEIAQEVAGGSSTGAEPDEAASDDFAAKRALDVEATAGAILAALPKEEHRAHGRVTHPPQTYVVQPGDVFYDIAYNFGFPQYQLEKANPDVDPGWISVGQVITVPSIDVLFPHPLVREKRIEIDLPTQSLRAYEGDTQVFEFQVSSGISSTPTLAGQFQILFKEEMAFARRWSLDMPYFMGFYEEREDFYNGFHELPITASGVRLSPWVLGWPASYGCIILDEGDAEALYDWAPVGTLVRVNGVAPGTPFGQPTLADIAPPVSDEAP